MANFQYKNPLSPIQVLGPQSVSRTSTFGTNFSILGTGGYMEVYSLTDLDFVIPIGQTGFIEYSANTIPIEFNKGTGTIFSPDVLTLNSDNMSSGRRRLGMLVYVYETNKIYKHTISNYGGLWSAATDASGPGGATVVVSDFGTTVKNNSVAGQNFINAWTASTIEGIGGYTNLDATWRELVTGSGGTSSADTFVTGFTLTANTITLTQNRTDQYSAFTISLSAYTGSSSTSGEYLPLSGGTVTGNTIFQSGLTANTLNVTGNTLLSGLTAATISATTYQNLPVTADTFVTGFTLSSNTLTLTQNRTDGYSSFTISLSAYTGSSSTLGAYLPLSGGTVTGNTIFNSGLTANTLTVTGNTLLSGLTAVTISATTYQNLPVTADTFVTGFTLTANTITLTQNRTDQYSSFTISLSAYTGSSSTSGAYLPLSGGTVTGDTIFQSGLTANTLNVTGNTLLSGLTASTISATTYYNYPDTFVTGFTLTANTITLTQNRTDGYSSFTISLSAYTGSSSTLGAYLPLSGGTVTGDTIFNSGLTANTLNVTGNTLLSGLTATTISATTYQNVNAVTGGSYSNGSITLSGTGNFASSISGFPTTFINDYLPLSGGTVTGNTIFQSGLTANTLNVTGNALLSGLTAATISATTYQNLPQDIFVTGGTYTSGNVIFTNNSGGTFTVTGFAVGGGGGQTFYLNLSQSQGGNRLLSTTGSTASEQTSGVTISDGVTSTIASFQSQPLNITLLPGGVWVFYLHSYKENNNASFNIFVEVYKITSGGTQTLLFTTDPAPVTTNSPNPSMQLSDGYFSGTPLSVSDSIVAVVRATNTGNQSHIITLVTEGSQHYSYAVSTIPTQQGLTCDTLSGCSIIQTIQTDVSNKLDKSGGTVSGATNFISGLTANTLNVTGNTLLSGLTATTISATTYENVNAVTGGSYSNGTITLSGTGNVNGNTITGLSTGGGGITWNSSNTTQSMTVDNGYVTTAATLTTFTLPSTIAFGKTVEIAGDSSGLWQLNQNSGQQIRFGNTATTVTSGVLSATSQGDCIKLLCVNANTSFIVTSSIGNIFFN